MFPPYLENNFTDASLLNSYKQFLLNLLTSSNCHLYTFDLVDHRQSNFNFTSERLMKRFYNFFNTSLFGNHWQRHFAKDSNDKTLLVAVPSHPKGNCFHWHGFLKIQEDVCFACVSFAAEIAAKETFGAQGNFKLQKVTGLEGKINYVLFQNKDDSGRGLPNQLLDYTVFLPHYRKETKNGQLFSGFQQEQTS